ncbi:MAG: tRNA lysidine(34) synthetase TilS [Ahniella sp.]|nr:tRNA lysidine(34) synthetase TilS [Ahniella sp.]
MRVEVPASSLGLEGEARVRRYQAMRSQLLPGETLLTAHHADDQAETLLARLARAAGSSALQGILGLTPWPPGHLWRPLLPLPRATLADYARIHALNWLDDPMNSRNDLERGFLRQRVLPALTERWPDFAAQAARSAVYLEHAVQAELAQARRQLARVQLPAPGVLSVDALLALADADVSAVIRLWLQTLLLPPAPARLLDELLRQLRDGSTNLHLGHTTLQIRQYRRVLYAFEIDPPREWPELWDGREPLATHTRCELVASEPFTKPLQVRQRQGGERIRIHARARNQELRDLFQRHGIPTWQRDVPLLYAGDTLVAVGDLFQSELWEAQVGPARLRSRPRFVGSC